MVDPHPDEHPDDGPLDRALALAFGASPAGATDGRGPVVLRQPGEEPDPTSSPGEAPVARTRGRYRVDREIGRGGVGRVLAGHDVDLGRVVAMKVLLDQHRQSPHLVRRFIEEAQIGGQLQHPGIVPVYELGLDEKEQPFFTMKLVQGRTLAQLLADRRGPEHDSHRFLGIFAQVCQTMAYAHSRGVIHRDLKPANIMVGSFGEVQVVDWGLAKVLGPAGSSPHRSSAAESGQAAPLQTVRSHSKTMVSEAGSVLGTPSYMPPEQAEGHSAAVNESADVFALGGILCEILTAAPPYPGPSHHALQLARDASLEEARGRLRVSPFDPSLIELTLRCLAAVPTDRPPHAGVLAEELERHLTSVEERARAAELEAAAARVRASEERRARRLTLGLAGALVTVVVLISGGTLWINRNRARRAAELAERVGRTLEEARLTGARALAEMQELHALQPGRDTGAGWPLIQSRWEMVQEQWARALAAARTAHELARSPDARGEFAAEVENTLSILQAQRQDSRAAFAQAERDHGMARQLESLIAQWGTRPWREVDEGFDQAYADYGLDVETMMEDEAVAFLCSRRIRLELARGMFAWIRTRNLSAREDASWSPREQRQLGAQLAKLMRILQRVDPDPVRTKIRESVMREASGNAPLTERGRSEYLRGIAADPELDSWPEQTLLFLAYLLAGSGPNDRQLAIDLLVRARFRFPDSAVILVAAGEWSLLQPEPDRAEAKALLTAATALEPELLQAWRLLAECHFELGELDRAEQAYGRALECAPLGHPLAFLGLSRVLLESGRYAEAERVLARGGDEPPHQAEAEALRGAIRAWAGNGQASDDAFARALELSGGDPAYRRRHARALGVQGRFAAARAELEAVAASGTTLGYEHWMLRGRLEFESGELAGAYFAFRQAAQTRPGDVAAENAQQATRALLTLEEQLPLSNGAVPAEIPGGERVIRAELHLLRDRPLAASLLFQGLGPPLPPTASLLGPPPFVAALAALRAALGDGTDATNLPAEIRGQLEAAARRWVEALLRSPRGTSPEQERIRRRHLRTLLRMLEIADDPRGSASRWQPLSEAIRAGLAP